MSLTTKLARCFGLARITTELPNGTIKQKTPPLPNDAVMPLGSPAGRPARTDASVPPRAAAPVSRAETAAPGIAEALARGGAHGPDGAGHRPRASPRVAS